jgi:hypothetical protein
MALKTTADMTENWPGENQTAVIYNVWKHAPGWAIAGNLMNQQWRNSEVLIPNILVRESD